MTDQHGIASLGVQLAISAVSHGEGPQLDATVELQPLLPAKQNPVPGKGGDRQAGTMLGRDRARSRGFGNRSTLTSPLGRGTFGPKTYSVNVFFDFSYATL